MGAESSKLGGNAAAAARTAAAAAAHPTDVINLELVKIGFRAYYWYPREGRPIESAPATPLGLYRRPYCDGFIYTQDNAALPPAGDGVALGRLLGYIHPYAGRWTNSALWVSWYLVTNLPRPTLMWAEAVPCDLGIDQTASGGIDQTASGLTTNQTDCSLWPNVLKRLREIEIAIAKIHPRAQVLMQVKTHASCGNPY